MFACQSQRLRYQHRLFEFDVLLEVEHEGGVVIDVGKGFYVHCRQRDEEILRMLEKVVGEQEKGCDSWLEVLDRVERKKTEESGKWGWPIVLDDKSDYSRKCEACSRFGVCVEVIKVMKKEM